MAGTSRWKGLLRNSTTGPAGTAVPAVIPEKPRRGPPRVHFNPQVGLDGTGRIMSTDWSLSKVRPTGSVRSTGPTAPAPATSKSYRFWRHGLWRTSKTSGPPAPVPTAEKLSAEDLRRLTDEAKNLRKQVQSDRKELKRLTQVEEARFRQLKKDAFIVTNDSQTRRNLELRDARRVWQHITQLHHQIDSLIRRVPGEGRRKYYRDAEAAIWNDTHARLPGCTFENDLDKILRQIVLHRYEVDQLSLRYTRLWREILTLVENMHYRPGRSGQEEGRYEFSQILKAIRSEQRPRAEEDDFWREVQIEIASRIHSIRRLAKTYLKLAGKQHQTHRAQVRSLIEADNEVICDNWVRANRVYKDARERQQGDLERMKGSLRQMRASIQVAYEKMRAVDNALRRKPALGPVPRSLLHGLRSFDGHPIREASGAMGKPEDDVDP